MTSVVKQDILRFEIAVVKMSIVECDRMDTLHLPIHNVELMQVLQSEQQLCAIEPAALLVEALFALEVVEELPAIDKSRRQFALSLQELRTGASHSRQDEIQLLFRLETELERHDERIIDSPKH